MNGKNHGKIFLALSAIVIVAALISGYFLSRGRTEEMKNGNVKEQLPEAPRKPEKKFTLDPEAKHACEIVPFGSTLAEGESATLKIILENSAPAKKGVLDLGNMPNGINAKFSESDGYSLEIGPDETETEIKISRAAGSQKGSLNIPVFFSEEGESGKVSTAVCQINILSK